MHRLLFTPDTKLTSTRKGTHLRLKKKGDAEYTDIKRRQLSEFFNTFCNNNNVLMHLKQCFFTLGFNNDYNWKNPYILYKLHNNKYLSSKFSLFFVKFSHMRRISNTWRYYPWIFYLYHTLLRNELSPYFCKGYWSKCLKKIRYLH